MTRTMTVWLIAACAGPLACASAPTEPAGPVEVGRHTRLIQGFEDKAIFAKTGRVSYLSGVPETSQVEVWDTALYNRQKLSTDGGGVACRIVGGRVREGASALEATFARPDRALRISLRNNLNQPGADRPDANSLGWFDAFKGEVFNPAEGPVAVEMRMLGGYAVTDRSRTFALIRTLSLRPGWNELTVTAEESSATFVDPYDATCVEFTAPPGTKLLFDNFRMEREALPTHLARVGRCFDFGVRHFNCPGFTYGSLPYDEGRGYGFTDGKGLTHGGDLHSMNDALTRDGFRAPATFKVKLPDGAYRVRTMTGNYWGRRDTDLDLEIKAEGKRVHHRPALSAAERRRFKYAHERTDHGKRDVDLWGTYEEGTYFRTVEFTTRVSDGALELEFLRSAPEGRRASGDSVWNYIIIYPEDKHRPIAPELAWLDEKVRRVYNKVCHTQIGRVFALYNREEVICPEEFLFPDLAEARRKALRPTPDQAARGYLHFLRHHHDLMTPDSVPLPVETGDRLAVFATPGQTVQWTVGLYPLKDLKQVSVAMTDFKGKAGRIPGKAVEVRLASYRPMTPVSSAHSECFNYPGEGLLMPVKTLDVSARFPRRFWMSLPVPAGARPGVYQAEAAIRLAGRKTSAVRVVLRVLPFKLDEPTDTTFAFAYRGAWDFWGADHPHLYDFMRGAGLNTIWYTGGAEGRPAVEKAAAAAGLKVQPADRRKVVDWRWPENYRTYMVERARKQGKTVSFGPRHTGWREGRRMRFTMGFWLWRSGIRHRVIQTQHNAAERVYYAHHGHCKFGPAAYTFCSLERPGLFLPAPTVYEIRDGIYDYRYIRTLEAAAGKDEQARAALARLKESLQPNLDHYYFQRKRNFNHIGRYGLKDTVWPGRRYRMARWALARAIAAARGKPIQTTSAAVPVEEVPPIVLHSEYFGPFWVHQRQFLDYAARREGVPELVVEVPAAPVGRNWVTVLAKMKHPSKRQWVAALRDADGREIARRPVGELKRWKMRWVLYTAHLAPGAYTLAVLPAGGKATDEPVASAAFEIVPGIE